MPAWHGFHRALRDFPHAGLQQEAATANRDQTLAGVEQLLAVIARRPTKDATDLAALDRLVSRRDWLRHQPAVSRRDLAALGPQVIHGDYQETNLFFADGQVCAVIDWNALASRLALDKRSARWIWLLARRTLCREFVAADPRRRTAATFGTRHRGRRLRPMCLYHLWSLTAVYLDGNDRVRQFIRPGRYQPFATRWAVLRDALM